MTAVFELAFRLGFTPWEGAGRQGVELLVPTGEPGPVGAGPRGRVLDLGCGSGEDACRLALHGFDVTGVDAVARAVERARQRAGREQDAWRRPGAPRGSARFVVGDVRDLPGLGIGSGFDLLLDVGCFHGLDDAGRAHLASGATALSAPGALLALLAFAPGRRRGPLPRGAGTEDVRSAFAGWELERRVAADPELVYPPLRRTRPTWYLLRRSSTP